MEVRKISVTLQRKLVLKSVNRYEAKTIDIQTQNSIMAEIKIIDKVALTKESLMVRGTKQVAHLRQGELDGACAVYSLMMCLVIEKIIKRNIITNVPESLRRNTSDGRLINHFLEKQGMVVDGYELKNLQDELQSAFRKKVKSFYYSIDDSDLLVVIKEAIDNNHPVEIIFSRKRQYGHAVVIIGYKEEKDKTSFYCLDPGYPIEACQLWNNVLEVDLTATAKYNCRNFREDSIVAIEEAMTFEKR